MCGVCVVGAELSFLETRKYSRGLTFAVFEVPTRMSLPCRITALIAVVGATAAAATTVRTPFGDVHRSCVLRVPSGSTVGEAADGRSVTITYANGTAATLPACAAAPAASYAVVVARRRPQDAPVGDAPVGGAANPPTWKGWPFHLWFGAAYATFTKPALIGDIIEMNTTWLVPARPTNTRGNASDPWGGHAPTLSTWIGVQGGAVLQPVLEWNGLVAGDFDISSWNCCPAGYVVHSDPVGGLRPGDVLLGSVRQSAADNDVFTVTSTLARAGVPPVTTSLAADMRGVAGWKPQWAEAIVGARAPPRAKGRRRALAQWVAGSQGRGAERSG